MVWPINRVRVGSLAPDFELPTAGTGDVKLRLSQLFHQGWVVLLFFPFSFSPACTQELATFQALLPRFTSLGATVVAVSVDSPFVLRAFAERLGITFPL
ncbi:MAG TPA: redoxin domain-containing protein, partial [Bacillota bacterium]